MSFTLLVYLKVTVQWCFTYKMIIEVGTFNDFF